MDVRDQKIGEVLAKFGEPMAGNVWRVQGTAVIYHKCLERIAAAARIWFGPPEIIRSERDEAVILVTGYLGGEMLPDGRAAGYQRMDWSIGEALIGVNYRISGKQSAYVYAMAEKRAKDRVILKLIELHGFVYSDEEADDLKQPPTEVKPEDLADDDGVVDDDPPSNKVEVQGPPQEKTVEERIRAGMNRQATWEAVQAYLLKEGVQEALRGLPEGVRDALRAEARELMLAKGWQHREKPAGDPSSRLEPTPQPTSIVSPDPYHKTNLVTLPTRVATAIRGARTDNEVEDRIADLFSEAGIDWDVLPGESQVAIDVVVDKYKAFLRGKDHQVS